MKKKGTMAAATENISTLPSFSFKEEHLKLNSVSKSINITDHIGKYDPLIFCRTCANMDSCLVPIFKKEGLEYNLNKKIEKYLPIHVSQEDDLPIHLCYHCASTLIAWDTLIVGCVEAEKKLNILKNSLKNKKYNEMQDVKKDDARTTFDSDDEPLINIKSTVDNKKINLQMESVHEKDDLFPSVKNSKPERFVEEPVLTFSTYQYQKLNIKSLLFEILNLKIENSFCCEICTTIINLKCTVFQEKINRRISTTTNLIENRKSEFKYRKTTLKGKNNNNGKREQVKSKSEVICKNCGTVLTSKSSLKEHRKTICDKSGFSCHKCSKIFKHRFNLLRHVRVIHEGERKHVCVDCEKKFRSRGEMMDHQNIHRVKKKIICDECGLIFLTKASFYSHRKSHRTVKCEKMAVYYSCEKCQKKFTTKKSRNQHELIHTGEKPIVCNVCGKNFRTKANFSQHSKIHSEVKPFGCDFCGKAFARKDHMRIHVRCHTGEKPFACDICGRAFAQMNDMKKHSKTHVKKYRRDSVLNLFFRTKINEKVRKFPVRSSEGKNALHRKCSDCGKKKVLNSMKRHLKVYHKSGKEAVEKLPQNFKKCPLCRKTYDDLYSHLTKEISENSDKWNSNKCVVCGQSYEVPDQLAGHLLVHVGEKKNDGRTLEKNKRKEPPEEECTKPTCEICGKTISRKYSMKRHLATHTGEKKFTCHHCGKQYAQDSGLQRHVMVIHEGVRKYKCPICSLIFCSNTELKSHQDKHTDPRPFQCDQCGRTFISQKHLYHHRKYHHTVNGMRQLCKICNKYFSSPSVLKRHHKVVHLGLKEFQCHVCSAQLSTKHYLQEHLRLHSDERPEVCTFCGKTFQMTGNLRQHMKTHMGKTQVCYVCGKGFTRRCHLLIHIGSHRGMEHPQCEHCNQVFLLKSDLEKHMKKEHSSKEKDLSRGT